MRRPSPGHRWRTPEAGKPFGRLLLPSGRGTLSSMIRTSSRTGRSMPNVWRPHSDWLAIAVTALLVIALSGCATAGKQKEGPEAEAVSSVAEKTQSANRGGGASTGYVDPALASASAAPAEGTAGGASAQPGPGLAGLVTQPTGIRAGSVSIFSAPAQVAPEPMATGTVAPTSGRVNATAGSMYSTPAPVPVYAPEYAPGSCGRAEDGVPLSC